MKSVATRRFGKLFRNLPPEMQKPAVKNYQLWRRDRNRPSLHFRLLEGSRDRFTMRIGDRYRALGRLHSGTVTWVRIGTHSEYDQLIRLL